MVGSGSTGRIVTAIDRVAQEKGHEGFIAYGRGEPSATNQYRVGSAKDIWLHGAKSLLFDAHGLGSKRATIAFIKGERK